MEIFLRNVKYAVRMLMRAPGFTAVAVLTLALGIGANTAIFSVVQAVLLAPLPYRQPDRLMMLTARNSHGQRIYTSYPDFQDWQRSASSFERMAAFSFNAYDLSYPGASEHLTAARVSAGLFATLGTNLALGREFSTDEDHAGATPVAIITERLWQQHFSGGDVLGRTVTLDGSPYTVVGVLPARFQFLGDEEIEIYTPIGQADASLTTKRTTHAVAAIARLRSHVTRTQAEADLDAVQHNIDAQFPDLENGLGSSVLPLRDAITGEVSGMLLVLFASVGVVLLIACANVAALLLARAVERSREFAVRIALGAPRSRIVQQLLTESVLLSLAGAALGLFLAIYGVRPALALIPDALPRTADPHLNAPVLLFAVATAVLAGILFGLAPALKTWSTDRIGALKSGGRGVTSGHRRLQSTLVIGEVALTVVLLIGAGLLFRTLRNMWNAQPGFQPEHLVTFKVGLDPAGSSTPAQMRIAYQQLVERIRAIPGVQSADLTTLLPLTGQHDELPFWLGSNKPPSLAEAPRAVTYCIGPDYFRAMGIQLLRGRFFTEADNLNSPPVVIIDQDFASAYFANSDPLGRTITFVNNVGYRVVGIVDHVQHWSLGSPPPFAKIEAYTPFYQLTDEWLPVMHSDTTIVARTTLGMGSLLPALKSALYGGDSGQPIYELRSMEQIVSDSMGGQRFPTLLLTFFAGLALVLAAIGLYGLLANAVQQRTREIGIRMAMGAETGDVFRMVVGNGLKLALTGVALGIAAALVLTRVVSSLSHLIYGVGPNDPVTIISVSLLLVAVAALACYVPARRATRVAPTLALRQE